MDKQPISDNTRPVFLPGGKGRIRRRRSESERFWEKVIRTDYCWLWTAGKSHGYGSFRLTLETAGGTKGIQAHRFAYKQLVGPIPDGMTLDHRECRNKLCVRPAHVVLCTNAQNVLQPDSGPGINRAKTHCKFGHEFTQENTYLVPLGRQCQTCRKRRIKAWYEVHRAVVLG